MKISRRQFVLLATGLVSGCQDVNKADTSTGPALRNINVGPASNYATQGVYSNFRDWGFFVIRRKDQLYAMSALCTHRKCKLDAQRDLSFLCPCHGSTFDAVGHVTEGPAKRDLPMLPSYTSEEGHLIVSVPVL
jgi:Rieske Fe-S protein